MEETELSRAELLQELGRLRARVVELENAKLSKQSPRNKIKQTQITASDGFQKKFYNQVLPSPPPPTDITNTANIELAQYAVEIEKAHEEIKQARRLALDILEEAVRSKKALWESEERLRRTLQIETVGIIYFKTDGRITWANDTFLEKSGYSREDLEQGLLRWDVMTPPEWVAASQQAIGEFLTKGRTSPYEKEYIRKDDSRWWALFTATLINVDEGVEFILDITESKRVETALRESEEMLRLINDNAPVMIGFYDRNLRYRFVNAEYSRFFGVPREQIEGRSIREFVGEEVWARFEPWMLRALAGERITIEDMAPNKHGPGLHSWTEETYIPKFAPDGSVEGFYALVIDITKLKYAEETVRRSEERQAYLLRLSDALRPLSNPLEIKAAALRILGEQLQVDRVLYAEIDAYDETVVISENYVREGVPKLIARMSLRDYAQSREKLGNGERLIVTNIDTDSRLGEAGRAFYQALGVKSSMTVSLSRNDKWVANLDVHHHSIREWTHDEINLLTETAERTWYAVERARSEEALHESEENLRGVTNIVPDLLWYGVSDGSTNWCNERWTEYTGQTSAQAIGWGWVSTIHPDDREIAVPRYREAAEQGKPLQQEYRIRRYDGEYRWFLVRVEPMLDEEGRVIRMYGAATDINQQRTLQEDLEKRVRERTSELALSNSEVERERERLHRLSIRLLEVQETERRYLARELHDEIGQYLTGLKFMLESIQLSEKRPNQQLKDTITKADELMVRTRELSLSLRPSLLDDMGLLPALLSHIQRYTAQTQIQVEFYQRSLKKRLPAEIEITVYRLVQEALNNVAKYAKVDKVTVQILVDDLLTVLIQDEGKGFDLFQVLANYNSTGLSAMRERVELAGGQFTVETEPDYGTTIIAEIPLEIKIKPAKTQTEG